MMPGGTGGERALIEHSYRGITGAGPSSAGKETSRPRIALFLQNLEMGGAEQAMLTSGERLLRSKGALVDFFWCTQRGALLERGARERRNLVELGTASKKHRLIPLLSRLPWEHAQGSCCRQ